MSRKLQYAVRLHLTKVRIVKALVFPVVMYAGDPDWTIKKAECWRTDAFEHCAAREDSWESLGLKEIKPVSPKGDQPHTGRTEAEAKEPKYFGHLIWRAVEKTLTLGNIEGKRRRGCQRMRCSESITDSMDMKLSKLWEILEDTGACTCSPWGCKDLDMT